MTSKLTPLARSLYDISFILVNYLALNLFKVEYETLKSIVYLTNKFGFIVVQALSEAMLMWERDRSSLGWQLSASQEKLRLYEATAEKKESVAIQTLRKEVHNILETREKLVHELRYDQALRLVLRGSSYTEFVFVRAILA